MQVESLDNISNEVLDLIKSKFGNNPEYSVIDNRGEVVFGKKRKYFLFSCGRDNFTYIWINNNLWQYRFCNIKCSQIALWENPLDILNKLLDD